jgi:hypothetical protein
MTEIEAHQFVERWDKITFTQRWRAKTEVQMALRLEQLFMGLMFGAIAVMLTSVGEYVIAACAFLGFSFSFWLYLKARKARHALLHS